MFQLKFTLQQHTPIIHFQHDQEGATLRATEVKPKLDRFVLTVLGNSNYDEGIRIAKAKGWLIGEHKALSYKMQIEAGKLDNYLVASRLSTGMPGQQDALTDAGILSIAPSPYFAQEKEISDLFNRSRVQLGNHTKTAYSLKPDYKTILNSFDKLGILSKTSIKVTIFSFNIELLNTIGQSLEDFFACKNFGTRQTKGFGCFTVATIDDKPVSGNIISLLKKNFTFVYSKTIRNPDLSSLFYTIQEDYKLLKSGRNPVEKPPYIKSKLFNYSVNGNTPIRWEKRKIKQEIQNKYPYSKGTFVKALSANVRLQGEKPPTYDANGNESWDDSQNFEYRYIRAVLGLAEQYEFLTVLPELQQKRQNLKFVVKITSRDGIERFASPILFKIINSIIYLAGNNVSQEILSLPGSEKWFDFELTLKENNQRFTSPEVITSLQTPASFSLADFVEKALADNKEQKIQGYTKL